MTGDWFMLMSEAMHFVLGAGFCIALLIVLHRLEM